MLCSYFWICWRKSSFHFEFVIDSILIDLFKFSGNRGTSRGFQVYGGSPDCQSYNPNSGDWCLLGVFYCWVNNFLPWLGALNTISDLSFYKYRRREWAEFKGNRFEPLHCWTSANKIYYKLTIPPYFTIMVKPISGWDKRRSCEFVTLYTGRGE